MLEQLLPISITISITIFCTAEHPFYCIRKEKVILICYFIIYIGLLHFSFLKIKNKKCRRNVEKRKKRAVNQKHKNVFYICPLMMCKKMNNVKSSHMSLICVEITTSSLGSYTKAVAALTKGRFK